MRGISRCAPAAALLLLLGIAGCGAPEEPPRAADPGEADVRALTREQIQEHAEAMSPAMAESLGIVDTTIRIERPVPAESMPAPELLPETLPAQ